MAREPNGRFKARPEAPKKGQGWGGPAQGASGSRITADERGAAIRALSKDPEHMAAKMDLAAEMLALRVQIARAPETQALGLAAAESVERRLLGAPMQPSEVSGPGGKAIEVDSPLDRIASRLAGLAARGRPPERAE